jgi:OmpA-OmpF porin, OOP family
MAHNQFDDRHAATQGTGPGFTPLGKALSVILIGGFIIAGLAMMGYNPLSLFSRRQAATSSVPQVSGSLQGPVGTAATASRVALVPAPSDAPSNVGGSEIRFNVMGWNAQRGLVYANGGQRTTRGSIMERRRLKVNLVNQNDVEVTKTDMLKFAQALSQGESNPSVGAHFGIFMGDGTPAILAALNDQLAKYGEDYVAEVIGAVGYSRGEDKFMGPPEWKANPQSARGGVVSGYLRDGDWNIALYWLGINKLPNNPDERTYDPEALNWVAAPDYLKAADMYITGYCEERDVVIKGRRTGDRRKICVQGTVTWTPGDVNVARQKGGLVSILSTREGENAYQMPSIIVGLRKWNKANAAAVQNILVAASEGADQVRNHEAARRQAAELCAEVFNDPKFDWYKYADIQVERDRQGLQVELGGSAVANLADNMVLFGLNSGSANLFQLSYELFGKILVEQYPKEVPSFPPLREILNTSYLEAAISAAPVLTAAEAERTYTRSAPRTEIGRRSWDIRFKTGSAEFSPEATSALEALLRDIGVGQLTVDIHGHTDDVGDAESNMTLSRRRAQAVKTWLERQAPNNFPEGRVNIHAHGETQAYGETERDRMRSRRVEIVLAAQ